MKRLSPIYVETTIHTTMDELWEHTQNPELHTAWDARFSDITNLDRAEGEPQRFNYKTNIGFGIAIEGTGESVGHIQKDTGERVSSLKFWTDHPLSLIGVGRGYWKYVQKGDTIAFITQYDYQPRFGKLGQLVDRFAFRPMLGWATAISFDVLKKWLEKGYHPRLVIQRTLCYWLVSFLLAFVWIYQGLVPKLLTVHPQEVDMLASLTGDAFPAQTMVPIVGVIEILFGLFLLLPFNKRYWFLTHILLFSLLTIASGVADIHSFRHSFNPLTFNLALIVLSLIGYLNAADIPSAKHCKRQRKG